MNHESKARVAFISLMVTQPWGGSEPLWRDTALRLKQRGHDVVACVKDWGAHESPQISRLAEAGCEIVRRRAPRMPRWWQRGFRRIPGDPFGLRPPNEVADLAASRPALAVLCHGASWVDDFYWKPLAAAGVPFILVIQACNEQWWPTDAERDERASAYKAAHSVYFVSEANRRLVADQIQFDHPRAKVVRNPYNLKSRAVQEWPDDSAGLRLAFVGRLEPGSKGCDLLLRVLALDKWRQRPVRCSFIGSGLAAESVRQMAQRLDLSSVSFPGHAGDIAAVWREHHALVLPSRYEGLPLAVVEAMSCGRMCIVTDVSGNAELLEDGISGFVAEGASVHSLDRAMDRAWERRSAWKHMGEAAYDSVLASVPADPASVFCEEIESILGSLPGKSGRPN
jgi:glycosyltransferase involved in cell wall biosynthesis